MLLAVIVKLCAGSEPARVSELWVELLRTAKEGRNIRPGKNGGIFRILRHAWKAKKEVEPYFTFRRSLVDKG